MQIHQKCIHQTIACEQVFEYYGIRNQRGYTRQEDRRTEESLQLQLAVIEQYGDKQRQNDHDWYLYQQVDKRIFYCGKEHCIFEQPFVIIKAGKFQIAAGSRLERHDERLNHRVEIEDYDQKHG